MVYRLTIKPKYFLEKEIKMSKKEETVKINFFKKIWYSITKFEQYPAMAVEGFKRAMGYLVMLTAIVTIFITIGSILQLKTVVNELAKYIQDNIPEFSYEEGKISMNTEENIIISNVENVAIDKIVIAPSAKTEEEKEQVQKENEIEGITVYFFDEQIILNSQGASENLLKQTFSYSDFIANYTGENIQKFDKTELVQYLTGQKMSSFFARYGIAIFAQWLIISIFSMMLNALEVAILGWVTMSIARLKIKFVAIYNMAVYSLTLSTFLNITYIIINYFTSFTITYFQVAYIAIAYIYLAAVIFILKDDLIKKMQEVEKIQQEQIKVREEIKAEEKKEEKEDNEGEDKEEKDDDKSEGTQGSEA